jgi:hypothetical protein
MSDVTTKVKEKEIDLDALAAIRREAAGKNPTVKFGGKTFKLPVEMPFAVVEAVGQISSADDDDQKNLIMSRLMVELAQALFGDRYKEFLGLHPSTNDVTALVENISIAYGTDSGESQASGTS